MDLMGRSIDRVTRPWRAIALHGTYACRLSGPGRSTRTSAGPPCLLQRASRAWPWMFLTSTAGRALFISARLYVQRVAVP
jgi:hypothetical protein